MVALKEVGDLALTQFWVSKLACGCGTAQYEVSTLFGTV